MKNLATVIFALSIAFTANAQTETLIAASNTAFAADYAEKGAAGAFGESIAMFDMMEEEVEEELVAGFKRSAKTLDDAFTGITIQLTATDRQLEAGHQIYSTFGGIKVKEMLSPKYCYFLGEFTSVEGAEKFLNDMVIAKFPNAKVVTFKKGNIK